MQGSPRGVSVSVKILFSRFNASHGLVLVSAHSILFIPIFQCDLGGIFDLGGLDFFWWVVQFVGLFWWLHFFA